MSILAPNRKPVSRYQPRARELPPLPPRWDPHAVRAGRRDEVPLWHFVFLSLLLHALAILLFGAPQGGSREGRALWGSLDVVIRDSFQDTAPPLKIERALRIRKPAPAAPAAREERAPRAAAQAPREPTPPPIAVPRVLDRLEQKFEVPPFEVPKPTQAAPESPGRVPVPAIQAAPMETVPAPAIQRPLAEPPQIEAPLPPVQPIEATPIDRVEAPRVDRQFAEPPKIEAPIVQPIPRIEAAPIEHVEAPRIERQFAEPPRIEAPVVQPVETPALPAPRKESNAPVTSAPAAPPAETLPSAEVPATAKPVAPPMERPAATPAPATRDVAPRIDRDNAPIEQAPSPFRGTPSRPDESASPGRATPSLDLDALRKRAGDITRQGTGNRAALPFPMPPVEKRKTKMEEALEKARKPDCRTAYKELGLAAVVPLIANEFGEGTCRW